MPSRSATRFPPSPSAATSTNNQWEVRRKSHNIRNKRPACGLAFFIPPRASSRRPGAAIAHSCNRVALAMEVAGWSGEFGVGRVVTGGAQLDCAQCEGARAFSSVDWQRRAAVLLPPECGITASLLLVRHSWNVPVVAWRRRYPVNVGIILLDYILKSIRQHVAVKQVLRCWFLVEAFSRYFH